MQLAVCVLVYLFKIIKQLLNSLFAQYEELSSPQCALLTSVTSGKHEASKRRCNKNKIAIICLKVNRSKNFNKV